MEETFIFAQGLFVRALGIIFLIAYASLLVQVKGLYGANGIAPIRDTLGEIRSYYGNRSFFQFPILFWFKATDSFIIGSVLVGAFASVLIVLGIVPTVFLMIAWYIYFSLCVAGSPFLSFQWDVLLLETGFLGIFFTLASPPPALLVIALWCLLFRLMFCSGITKFAWGSKEWHDFSALKYHYETQPLPTRLGYYMHQLPERFGKFSVLFMYFVELIIPVLIFGTVGMRIFALFFLVLLQVLILLTGNYTYFNWLSIALCIPLLPDSTLNGVGEWVKIMPVFPSNLIMNGILNLIGAFYIWVSALSILGMFYNIGRLRFLLKFLKQYFILNSYGLFVHMTTRRDEIVIEGSVDGENWKEYGFRWKPGDLKKAPGLVAPHQPRLDWQMWFVPLSIFEQNPWLEQFLYRLLKGVPDVLALLKSNPFPGAPPKYLRVLRYRYRFSDLKTKHETGAWWRREYLGHYGPDVTYSLPSKS